MNNFVAVLKQSVERNTIDGISYSTPKKDKLKSNVLFLKQSSRGEKWYNLVGSNLLFHTSWLDCVVDYEQENIYLIFLDDNFLILGKKIVDFYDDHHYIDIKHDVRINRNHISNVIKIENPITNIDFGGYPPAQYQTICSECNKIVLNYCISDGVCNKCFDLDNTVCESCKNIFFNKNVKKVKVNDRFYNLCCSCNKKIYVCYLCKQHIINNYKLVDGNKYCNKCISKIGKVRCPSCGTYFMENSNCLTMVNHKYICNICSFYNRTQYLSGGILEYNYKPSPFFFGNDNSLYFGVEIEILTPYIRESKYDDKYARWLMYNVNKNEDFCYIKYDRSIGRDGMNGFEIVTHPFSYSWVKSDYGKELLNKIFSIKKYGCMDYEEKTCGLHIHLSKKAFETSLHLYEFLKFIYEHKRFSIDISGRTDIKQINEQANFEKSLPHLLAMADNWQNNDSDHHKAINLNSPNTVEVRIFGSTLQYDIFIKNIEFCKSLYELSKDMTDIIIDNFLNYIKINKEEYKYLYNFLIGVDYICV